MADPKVDARVSPEWTERGVQSVRELFPALADPAIVYLDSAATTQKPRTVIDEVTRYHDTATANAGRGTYSWATRLTERIEGLRARVAGFIGAAAAEEVVFTPGATAALNAVAYSWGLPTLRDGDEILYNPGDHAANVLPWLHLRELLAGFGRRITLVPYRSTAAGTADLTDLTDRLTSRTRLVTVSHLHHVYGGLTPVAALRARLPPEVLLCVDCSQSAGHGPLDVTALGADFAVFAGHKMFGAPGTGILYCHSRVHPRLRPFLPGGHSGIRAGPEGLEHDGMPGLLEGGTRNLPGILALGPALDFLEHCGLESIAAHNAALTAALLEGLGAIRGCEFLPGPAHTGDGHGVLSFRLGGITATDLGFVLGEHGMLLRTGLHCVPAAGPGRDTESVRVSTHVYTTAEEVGRFTDCVAEIAGQLR